jgi:glycosyltransferase involved in cell wall biosynthesis
MKIGIVTPGFSPSSDQIALPVLHHLAQRLSHHAEVHVFPIRYPYTQKPYTIEGISVHPSGGGTTRGLAKMGLLRLTANTVAAEHAQKPFSVLHAMWADEPGYTAATLKSRLNIPYVVSLLGGELVRLPGIQYGAGRSLMNRQFVRIGLARADRVLAGSTYLADLARRHVSAERLVPLALGLDAEHFDLESASRTDALVGQPALLHAASLVPVKDQATLLRAFAMVLAEHPEAHLHFVGSGPLQPALEAQARREDLVAHCTFHGQIPHHLMADYFKSADLHILASRHEGQELVVLEAAMLGVPTVGTRVGLLPDLVPDDLISAPGDANGLARAVNELIADPQRRSKLGSDLRARVLEKYTLDRTVPSLLTLYKQVAQDALDV